MLLYLKYEICSSKSKGTLQKLADVPSLYSSPSLYEIMKRNCLKKHVVSVELKSMKRSKLDLWEGNITHAWWSTFAPFASSWLNWCLRIYLKVSTCSSAFLSHGLISSSERGQCSLLLYGPFWSSQKCHTWLCRGRTWHSCLAHGYILTLFPEASDFFSGESMDEVRTRGRATHSSSDSVVLQNGGWKFF